MQNQIYRVTSKEILEIKKEFEKDESVFVAELNGHEIHKREDYFSEVSKIFNFPYIPRGFDVYNDLMSDLMWPEKDGYAVIINGFKDFLDCDKKAKQIIIDNFIKSILPWWQEDVEKYCVEGKAKPFNVYLVED